MNLNDCTKQELIGIIEHFKPNGLDKYLDNLTAERERTRAENIKKLKEFVAKKYKEYNELMDPYMGKQRIDIPVDVLKQASGITHEITDAERKLAAYDV